MPRGAGWVLLSKSIAAAFIGGVIGISSTTVFAFGGVGGGAPGGGMHVGGISGFSGAPSNGVGTLINMNTYLYDRHFRELKLAGQVPAVPEKLPSGARIVQLRVNGQSVPMALDSELGSSELEFEPGERYAEELYKAVLTKSVAVVGDAQLRDRIIDAAGKSQPIEIEGAVFNTATPYFIVKSVEDAK
jgi:hypothetical protein